MTHEIIIQSNKFKAIKVSTIHEKENNGQIKEKFDLYQNMTKVSSLVIFFNDDCAVFHGTIKYCIPKNEIVIKQIIDSKAFFKELRRMDPSAFYQAKKKGYLKDICKELGIELNNVIQLDDDLIKIKQERKSNSYFELFEMIQKFWPIYYKGGGHRSDLEKEKPKEKEKLNIYRQIGKDLNLSGNKVKHIRKIGIINPSYFEKIELKQISLYRAYLKCIEPKKK